MRAWCFEQAAESNRADVAACDAIMDPQDPQAHRRCLDEVRRNNDANRAACQQMFP
jgi:hypothetical protein